MLWHVTLKAVSEQTTVADPTEDCENHIVKSVFNLILWVSSPTASRDVNYYFDIVTKFSECWELYVHI